MDMLDKRLNDKGKNWRHVLKALKVLDYCLHEGSELVVTWARKNIYIIKTLREFIYIDEDGRDVGQNGTATVLPVEVVLAIVPVSKLLSFSITTTPIILCTYDCPLRSLISYDFFER